MGLKQQRHWRTIHYHYWHTGLNSLDFVLEVLFEQQDHDQCTFLQKKDLFREHEIRQVVCMRDIRNQLEQIVLDALIVFDSIDRDRGGDAQDLFLSLIHI